MVARFFVLLLCIFILSSHDLQAQDMWEGTYVVDFSGTPTGTKVFIKRNLDTYVIRLNNNQEYNASLTSAGLYGKDELGQEFYIKKLDGRTIMKIASYEFNLSPERSIGITDKKEDRLQGSDLSSSPKDPFEGLYKVRFMGEESDKKISIKRNPEATYMVRLDGEQLTGMRIGNTLKVKDDQGNSMEISFEGRAYKMRVMDLLDLEMIRIADLPGKDPVKGGKSNLDSDLIGTWVRSSSYSSGSGEFSFHIATLIEYQFFPDGQYRYTSRNAGGTQDVGADSGTKSSTGFYTTEIVKSSGEKFVLMDGERIPYYISEDHNVLVLKERSHIYKRQ